MVMLRKTSLDMPESRTIVHRINLARRHVHLENILNRSRSDEIQEYAKHLCSKEEQRIREFTHTDDLCPCLLTCISGM